MSVNLKFDYDKVTSEMDIFSENDIKELQQWTQILDISKLVPKDLSDKQLVLFYSACYGNVEKTKRCIEKYYKCRKNAPEFFNLRILETEELRLASETLEFFLLSGKSYEGHEVIFHRLHDTDPSKFNQESACKLLFMTVDLCLTSRGPQSGYIFVFDMQGVKLGHIMRSSLTSLRKMFQYVQEAVPIRMIAIHLLNTESILDKLMFLMKPLVDKQFFDKVNFHNKADGLDKLYEVIPRSCLPSDYGGSIADSQTLHKECMEQLKSIESYFTAEEDQRKAALPDTK